MVLPCPLMGLILAAQFHRKARVTDRYLVPLAFSYSESNTSDLAVANPKTSSLKHNGAVSVQMGTSLLQSYLCKNGLTKRVTPFNTQCYIS